MPVLWRGDVVFAGGAEHVTADLVEVAAPIVEAETGLALRRGWFRGFDRDDLRQEAWIGVLQARRPDPALLRVAARRRLIDMWRRHTDGRPPLTLVDSVFIDENAAWAHPGSASAPLRVELLELLGRVAALPPGRRAAVVGLAAGFSLVEIAEAEGASVQQIRNRSQLGRRDLRRAA